MSDTTVSSAAPAASESSGEGGGPPHVEGRPEGGQTDVDQSTMGSAPKKKAPSYRKIKVGNEEIALSDEDIARDYSKWRGADQKFREASQAKQSVEAFMKQLQEDPESVLQDKRLPIDRKKLAEKWLLEQIDEELKGPPDPRDKKLSEAERRLKEYEDREANEKQTQEQQAYAKEMESRKAAIGDTLSKAMQATHLSAHPETAAAVLREMATYMRAAKERGEEVSPEELVEHVHNSRFQQFYTLANQFEGDELIEFLGQEVVNRIRKADLARLRAGRDQGQSHKSETWEPRKSGKPTRMDGHSMKDHLRKTYLNK